MEELDITLRRNTETWFIFSNGLSIFFSEFLIGAIVEHEPSSSNPRRFGMISIISYNTLRKSDSTNPLGMRTPDDGMDNPHRGDLDRP